MQNYMLLPVVNYWCQAFGDRWLQWLSPTECRNRGRGEETEDESCRVRVSKREARIICHATEDEDGVEDEDEEDEEPWQESRSEELRNALLLPSAPFSASVTEVPTQSSTTSSSRTLLFRQLELFLAPGPLFSSSTSSSSSSASSVASYADRAKAVTHHSDPDSESRSIFTRSRLGLVVYHYPNSHWRRLQVHVRRYCLTWTHLFSVSSLIFTIASRQSQALQLQLSTDHAVLSLRDSVQLARLFVIMALHLQHGAQVPVVPTLFNTLSSTPSVYSPLPSEFSPYPTSIFPTPTPTLARAQSTLDAQIVSIEVPAVESTSGTGESVPSDAVSVLSVLEEEAMKTSTKAKATIGVLATLISYMSLNSLVRATRPELFIWQDEDREDAAWLASSKYWLDRKACRWLGICGGAHLQFAGERFGHRPQMSHRHKVVDPTPDWGWQNAWAEGKDSPEHWADDERVLRHVPEYVMEYAPLVHLFSGEQFWPCDIAEHLYHITPALNYTPLQSERQPPTLENLDQLNDWNRGRWIYLTSNDNVEERPEWLEGEKNIPVDPTNPEDKFEDNDGWVHVPGKTYLQGLRDVISDLKDWFGPGLVGIENGADFHKSAGLMQTSTKEGNSFRAKHNGELRRRSVLKQGPQKRRRGGRSDAPAVLVTVDKGHGVVDAFWFFFYSFNLGNVVFNVRFGNHVGDWEHTAIRFHNGKPRAVFFSEHNFGSAYSYEAVEKFGKRPVIYSAVGTHAMYATAGLHPYVLPWGILHDQTDRGPLWDPALNTHAYTYDHNNDTLRSSQLTPKAPKEWFNFAGHWGDKFYPLSDTRQYRFAGQYHYVNGPLGPKFKNLGRKKICGGPDSAPCVIKNWLPGPEGIRPWKGDEEDVEPGETEDEELVRAL